MEIQHALSMSVSSSCPQITKERIHCPLNRKESRVNSLPHTYAHTLSASTQQLFCCDWRRIIWVSQVTIGRPLQQDRNSPLHCQDYLPVKARSTQLSISRLLFALVSSLDKWKLHKKIPDTIMLKGSNFKRELLSFKFCPF